MISFTSRGFSGRGVDNFFYFLEDTGFFRYALPFLLIFALVYGILSRMELFKENKAVSAIVSISVGLMALQFDFVSRFFAEIFPRVGVVLSIILAIIILLGLFIDKSKQWILYIFLGIAAIITFIALYPTLEIFGIKGTSLAQYDLGVIIGWIVVIAIIAGGIAAVLGWKPKPKQQDPYQPLLLYPPKT